MPGFTTHYLFGVRCYKEMKHNPIKPWIQKHHCAYSLGMQGPDIFFYNLLSHLKHHTNPGVVLHNHNTGSFLKHLKDSLRIFPKDSDFQIGFCYYAGFLGHYTLDRICHPFVYGRTNYTGEKPGYFGTHAQLETDIDAHMLWREKKLLPSHFYQAETIRVSFHEERIIASMLHYAYRLTFPELNLSRKEVRSAIRSMIRECRLLRDPKGWKKPLAAKCELKLLGHPFLSSMIPSDSQSISPDPCNLLHDSWSSPWVNGHTSTHSFPDLYDTAIRQYKKLLPYLEEAICFVPSASPKKKPSYHPDILKGYSFLSGLAP